MIFAQCQQYFCKCTKFLIKLLILFILFICNLHYPVPDFDLRFPFRYPLSNPPQEIRRNADKEPERLNPCRRFVAIPSTFGDGTFQNHPRPQLGHPVAIPGWLPQGNGNGKPHQSNPDSAGIHSVWRNRGCRTVCLTLLQSRYFHTRGTTTDTPILSQQSSDHRVEREKQCFIGNRCFHNIVKTIGSRMHSD